MPANAREANVAAMRKQAAGAGVDIFGAMGSIQGNKGQGMLQGRAEAMTRAGILRALAQGGIKVGRANDIDGYMMQQAWVSLFAGIAPDQGDLQAAFAGRGPGYGQADGLPHGTGLRPDAVHHPGAERDGARLDRIEQQLMGVSRDMQRGRQRQPTFLNTFPPGVR